MPATIVNQLTVFAFGAAVGLFCVMRTQRILCTVVTECHSYSPPDSLCVCSVYKEKALGDVDIDPVYMNGWVAVYQFLFSIPLLIPSAIASNVSIQVR